MGNNLSETLKAYRRDLQRGVKEAEAELEELRARCRHLEGEIAAARRALGARDQAQHAATTRGGDRLKLHEAMAEVLRERENVPTSARELADEINKRRLYRKRDGSLVEVNQIHARANNYLDEWFEKRGSAIQLKPGKLR